MSFLKKLKDKKSAIKTQSSRKKKRKSKGRAISIMSSKKVEKNGVSVVEKPPPLSIDFKKNLVIAQMNNKTLIKTTQEKPEITRDLLKDRCRAFSFQSTKTNVFLNGAANPNSNIFNTNHDKKIVPPLTPRIASVTSLVSPNENFNVKTNDILKCKPLLSSSIDRFKSKIFVITKQEQEQIKQNYKTFMNFKGSNSFQNILNNKIKTQKTIEVIDLTVEDEKQNVDLKIICKNRI
jgi:hypothetical protein